MTGQILIYALIFVGFFAVLALLLIGISMRPGKELRHKLAMLDDALSNRSSATVDDALDIRRQELISDLPWLNKVLIEIELAPRLRAFLHQSGTTWTVGRLLGAAALAFAGAALIVWLRTANFWVSVLFGAVAAAGPFAYIAYRRHQRFDRFEQQLPVALDLMVSALRAGHSLISALSIVARESGEPISSEFRTTFDEQNFGIDMRTAMQGLAKRVPLQDVRMVVTAILIQRESGGNLAEVLEKVAHLMRERFRLKRQIRTHTAQGRLTGWILTLLPPGLGLILYVLNPGHMSLLWNRPAGMRMIYTAAVMTVIGALIIRRIVRLKV